MANMHRHNNNIMSFEFNVSVTVNDGNKICLLLEWRTMMQESGWKVYLLCSSRKTQPFMNKAFVKLHIKPCFGLNQKEE